MMIFDEQSHDDALARIAEERYKRQENNGEFRTAPELPRITVRAVRLVSKVQGELFDAD